MVPFAGYSMPVQYPAGLMAEHHHTREAAGLFDVSHMGQLRLVGPDAAAAFEIADARGRDRPAGGQAALRPAADRRGHDHRRPDVREPGRRHLRDREWRVQGGRHRPHPAANRLALPGDPHARARPARAAGPQGRAGAGAAGARRGQAGLHDGRPLRMERRRALHHPQRLHRRGRLRDFRARIAGGRAGARPARASPRSSPSGWARAIRCASKRGCACTATTSTPPPRRWKPR